MRSGLHIASYAPHPGHPGGQAVAPPVLRWKALMAGSSPAGSTARGPSYRQKSGLTLLLKVPALPIDSF